MKNFISSQCIVSVVLALSVLTTSANAKDTYWGIDAGMHKIDYFFELDVIQLQGIYGWETSYQLLGEKPLDVEFRGSIGIDDEGIELTYTAGAYARQEFNIGSALRPYVFAGIAHGKADVDGYGSDTETGLSYGAGFWYTLQNGLTISVEYMPQLVDDVSGFNFGVRF